MKSPGAKKYYRGNPLWNMGLDTIKELEVDQGILASGKEEIYGCIFGRDSLISGLKLLRAYEKTNDPYFLSVVSKILHNLASLQGKEINIESGEEPGKCIHEYRPHNHAHLTSQLSPPWYIYPDNIMRNYDSVDSTPLFLTTVYRYWEASHDEEFLKNMMPHVYAAIDWIILYGDTNHDGFIDYRLNPERTHGGLSTQSWMDSTESVFHEDGTPAPYPIAPVEVQAYTYTALKLWANHFREGYEERSRMLDAKAEQLKELFNQKYVLFNQGEFSLAAAVDGSGQPLRSVRSSMGHVLWASYEKNGRHHSILRQEYIVPLARRLLQPDLFEPKAGIRTLSSKSSQFAANSYHNGSIWPHDNSIIAEGLERFDFTAEAKKVRRALSTAIKHFATPIELFVYENGEYGEWWSATGQQACKKQAWSAAGLLA